MDGQRSLVRATSAQRWRVAALVSAASLVALTAAVALGAARGVDLATMRLVASAASPPLDLVVNAHTIAGQVVTTIVLSAVLSLVARHRWGGLAWIAPLFLLATGLVELGLKNALYHPSPPSEFVRASGNPLGLHVAAPSAFPSGHVTRLTFLAIIASQLWPHVPLRVVAAAFVTLTLFARMYIGDHWLSDVLGGLALGTLVASIAMLWAIRTRQRG